MIIGLTPFYIYFIYIYFNFLAIHLCEESVGDATLAICLKNRAAVYLKEEEYESVIADCTRYTGISRNLETSVKKYIGYFSSYLVLKVIFISLNKVTATCSQ